MPARLIHHVGASLLLAAGIAQAQVTGITDFSPQGSLSALDPAAAPNQVGISNTGSLEFGRFVAGTGGAITVSPAGARSRTGGVILMNSPTAQATFTVVRISGNANKSVILTLPVNGEVVLTSGANSMQVRDFVNASGNILSIASGSTALAVGATLTVAPNQPPGQYSGSFSATVNYE